MAANQQFKINSDQETKVVEYASRAHTLLLNQFSLRSNMQMIDRYFQREHDLTEEEIKARLANRMGDKTHIQNVTVPIVQPQVEATLAYLVNVFLTGYPIFAVAGDPTKEDAALQIETIIAENSIRAGWAREMAMAFRDGLKYNLMALELEWVQSTVADIDTVVTGSGNTSKATAAVWQGNVIRRMDLYNTFWDPRVEPSKIHTDAEFAGYIKLVSKVKMKEMMNNLFGKVSPETVRRAFESTGSSSSATTGGSNPFSYFAPIINPMPLVNPTANLSFNWMDWATNTKADSQQQIKYQNVYEVMYLYARIIPSEFNMEVPERNTPQVWKFVIVNGKVVIFAERQTNAHNYIPMFFGQPIEDGLRYQTKSFAMNVMDMQDVASTLMNGFIASKRRLVGDRVLYDPSRIKEKDINAKNPAAKIPVRPSAYGKPLSEAVYQFPFRDEQTASLLQGVEMANKYANLINNTNPAQQGQFVPGNKTLKEYEDIMGHGNSGNQIIALMIENQILAPMKEALKLNILQYQPPGSLFNNAQGISIQITPEQLREATISFKVSDGMLPMDKQLSSDEFQIAFQILGSSPQIASQYNLGALVSYLFKIRGADITPFEKPSVQVQYEQQMAAWQQAAESAAKSGSPFSSPMPQVPPQLQQGNPSQQIAGNQSGQAQQQQESDGGQEMLPGILQ